MAKKAKVPKRIAGVRIPKKIRKGPIGQFLCSRTGQAMMAEALVIAGGALAANRATQPGSATSDLLSSSGRQLKRAGRAIAGKGADAQQFMGIATERLAYAGLEAIKAFRHALAGEESEALHEEALHEDEGGDERSGSDSLESGQPEDRAAKKKMSGTRSESATPRH
jgi:hypothetical protein